MNSTYCINLSHIIGGCQSGKGCTVINASPSCALITFAAHKGADCTMHNETKINVYLNYNPGTERIYRLLHPLPASPTPRII